MTRCLEDFDPGQTFGSARLPVDSRKIKEFAAEFGSKPFHVDAEAASRSLFRGLAANGWPTAAKAMCLLVESDSEPAGGSIGGGFDDLRWPRPVRPGDELHLKIDVLEVRASKSKSIQGTLKVRTTALNQRNEPVQFSIGNLIVASTATHSREQIGV